MTTTTAPAKRTANLLELAVLMNITFEAFGTTRKVSVDKFISDIGASENVGDGEKKRLRVTKKILESPEFDDINSLDAKVRQWVNSQCLQAPIRGMKYVPVASIEGIHNQLTTFRSERSVLVEILCYALDEIKERDRAVLGERFDETDYPSTEVLRNAYSLRWEFIELKAPDALKGKSKELYEQAKANVEARIQEASDLAQQILREEFTKLVNHMVDKLSPDINGDKKRFRSEPLVNNLAEFLESFKNRNIAGDEDLAKLVDQARGCLQNVSPADLAKSSTARDTVVKGMAEVKKLLDTFLEDGPIRDMEI